MTYELILTEEAINHLSVWRKSGQKKLLQKIFVLLEELRQHPRFGTGQVEALKGNLSGAWSRRIDKANRIIYTIEDSKVCVTVISMRGHYS